MASMVETTLGRIEGTLENGHHVFRGIPFASPPLGRLRFRAPEPMEPWTGVRETKTMSPAAPQSRSSLIGLSRFSEDCLYLNIWTPGPDGEKRPVMFWIHGGSFTAGGASQKMFDGSALAKRGDVVVVTINYRLGSLGFAFLGGLLGDKFPTDSNPGLRDQIMALNWVHENIEAFGGDPRNVTIFGESAGGFSVGCLLAAPTAKGLFHRAICQSGATHLVTTPEDASQIAKILLDELEISPARPEKLWTLPAEVLVKAQRKCFLKKITLGTKKRRLPLVYMTLLPVSEGDVLPEDPYQSVVDGAAKDISTLVGTNLDEHHLFIHMADQGKIKMDRKGLVKVCGSRIPGHGEKVAQVYETAHREQGRSTKPTDLFGAVETDRMFRIPSIRLAEAQSRHQPDTYMYLLDWPCPMMDGIMGCCHVVDVPFVFGMVDSDHGKMFTGGGPEARALSEKMQDAWIAFTKTGKPGHPGLGDWPAYDLERRATMRLGKQCRLEDAPMDVERRFWDEIL